MIHEALVALEKPPTADLAARMIHTGLVGVVVTIHMGQVVAAELLTATNLWRLDFKDMRVVWLR
jgi:hypothetical protein